MSGYEQDILEWSEHQAALLRQVAAGERVNEQPDWPNIIEEIESVGRSETRSCESHIVLALVHDLKAEAWPLSRDVAHWRAEARHHRNEAKAAFTPSMRQKLDMARLYRRALSELPDSMDGQPPLPVPTDCPVTLDELLSEP
jgi:hypothetical protein